jgi:D-sedoheptulose 7-phosphate isomerase
MQAPDQLIAASLQEGVALRQAMLDHTATIAAAGQLWIETLRQGRVIYLAGNGGSAADAQHLAAEMIGRFERLNGYPALALTVDTSALTALGNDFGFEQVFSRQLLALGRPGDLLVGISTSGNSPNIVRAAESARALGMKVVGMTGASGGQLEAFSDVCLKVPSQRTCRIQEVHLSVGHIWCEMVEAALPTARQAQQGTVPCG